MKNVSPQGAAFTRRTFIGLTSATAAVAALAACTENSQPAIPATSSGAIAGGLTIWYSYPPGESPAKGKAAWQKYLVDPFNKRYPNVKVTGSANDANSMAQKIQVALAAAGPDLIPTSGPSNSLPLAEAGYFANLDAASKKYRWKETVLPWALDLGYDKGHLVTLPVSYETLVLYYNKTLFEKHGWKPPTSRASLEKLSEEMQSKGIVPFAAGNSSYERNTGHYVSAFMNEYAGAPKLYDCLTGKSPWTDPEIVGSMKLLKEYFDKGYFAGGVKQYFSTQDPQKYASFADGKAGMFMSGSWETTTLPSYFGVNGNKNDWALVPLPPLADGIPTGVYPLAVGGTMSVNAKSKNLPAATAYLGWYFSDGKDMWANAVATGAEPLPIKFAHSDVPKAIDPRYAAMYEAINAASVNGNVGYVTWTSFGPSSDTYIPPNFDKVLTGALSVEDFCSGIEAAFKSDKAKGLIPPLFRTGS